MKNKKNVPDIRFKGFAEEWDERQLGEIANNFYGGGTPRTTVDRYWNGHIPWIQTSDLKEGQVFWVVPQKYISDSGVKESATKLVPENSIAIITRVGVGKLSLIPFQYATSQDFLSISKLKIDGNFAAYAIHRKMQVVLKEVQGTSIKGITKEELLAKEIEIPTDKCEQQAIGNYFQNIDRLINTSQTKLDKLKNIKKACLEKMFPRNGSTTPELRFKGFTEKWKEIKVKNLGNVITGNTPSKTEPTFWGGNFIWVTAQDLKNKYINDSILKLTIQGKEKARVIPRNSIIVTCIASIGLNGINNVECATNQQINSIVCDNEYYYEYIYYSFEHRANLLRGIAGQTAVPIINKSTFEDFSIISPKSKIEQERIGNIFKNLDDLIAKTEQQINKLKNIKKACLDKMFVNTEDKI